MAYVSTCFFNENKPYIRPIMQLKIVTCVCQIYSVYYIIVRRKDSLEARAVYYGFLLFMEINLKFIWRPAGVAWCKVKWLFISGGGGGGKNYLFLKVFLATIVF